jgi:hypothetical protein
MYLFATATELMLDREPFVSPFVLASRVFRPPPTLAKLLGAAAFEVILTYTARGVNKSLTCSNARLSSFDLTRALFGYIVKMA